MWWTDILPRAWRGAARSDSSRANSASESEEIDEELMFHLRSLVEDQVTKGASFDTA